MEVFSTINSIISVSQGSVLSLLCEISQPLLTQGVIVTVISQQDNNHPIGMLLTTHFHPGSCMSVTSEIVVNQNHLWPSGTCSYHAVMQVDHPGQFCSAILDVLNHQVLLSTTFSIAVFKSATRRRLPKWNSRFQANFE